MRDSTVRLLLLAIFVVTFLKGVWWAAALPPYYGGSDEVSHFDYLRHIVEERRIPVYGQTALLDYDPASSTVRGYVVSNGGYNPEALQPPLGYLLPALILPERTPEQLLTFARLSNVALAVGIVSLSFIVVRMLRPDDPGFALTAAGLVAFQPTLSFVTSTFNNDALAVLLGTGLLAVAVRTLVRRTMTPIDAVALGALFGLGLLTKQHFILFGPALFLLTRWTTGTLPQFLSRLGVLVGLTLLVAGWWYVRPVGTSGDWFGALLPRVASVYPTSPFAPLGSPFLLLFWPGYWIATVKSFFAFYSWDHGIGLSYRFGTDDALLGSLMLVSLIGVVTTIASTFPRRGDESERPFRRFLTLSLLLVGLFGFGILAYSYLWDIQPGGRWFQPIVVPIVLLILTGLWRMTRRRHRLYVSVGLLAFFLALHAPILTFLTDRYLLQ